MSKNISQPEFNRIREYIHKECGISIDDSKEYLIEDRIGKLLKSYDCTNYTQLINKAKDCKKNHIRDAIVDAITTNETLWFRDIHPFETLTHHIIPERTKQTGNTDLSIWSAASSTGQEAYSIAITLLECRKTLPVIGSSNMPIHILGTDISPSSLFTAMSGRYNEMSIGRGLSDERLKNNFTQHGRYYQINMDVKQYARFKQHNLQQPFTNLGLFDIVMLRNVLIYFSMELRIDILNRIRDNIKPEGYLLLGSTENLPIGINGFEQIKIGKTIAYKRKNSG